MFSGDHQAWLVSLGRPEMWPWEGGSRVAGAWGTELCCPCPVRLSARPSGSAGRYSRRPSWELFLRKTEEAVLMEPTAQLETCLPNQCQEGGRPEPTAAPAIGGPSAAARTPQGPFTVLPSPRHLPRLCLPPCSGPCDWVTQHLECHWTSAHGLTNLHSNHCI